MPSPSSLGTHIRCCIACREFHNANQFPNIDGNPVLLCSSCFVPNKYYTNQDNGRRRASIHNLAILLRAPGDGAICTPSPGGTLDDRYTYFKIHDARYLDGSQAPKTNTNVVGRTCLICREMKQLNDYNASSNISDSYTCIACYEKNHPRIEPPQDDAIWIQPQAPDPIPIAPSSPTFVKEVSWKQENSFEKVQYTTSPNTWDQPKTIEKQSSWSSTKFESTQPTPPQPPINNDNVNSSFYTLTKEGSWRPNRVGSWKQENQTQPWTTTTTTTTTTTNEWPATNDYPMAASPTPYIADGWSSSSYKNLSNDMPPSNSPQPVFDFPPAYTPEPVFSYSSIQQDYISTQGYNVPNTSYNYDIDTSHINENNISSSSNDKPQVSSIKSPSSNNSSPTNSSWLSRLKTSIFGSPKNNDINNEVQINSNTTRDIQENEIHTKEANNTTTTSSPVIAGNAFEAYYHTLENESKPNITIQTTTHWESTSPSHLAQEEPLTWSSPVKREDSLLFNTPPSMRNALKELVQDAVKTGVWEKVQNEEMVGSPLWNEIKEEGWDQPKPLWL